MAHVIEYCDHCADSEPTHFVGDMPVDFESGNVGESASLCEKCFILLTQWSMKWKN